MFWCIPMRRRRGVCVESWGADAGGLTTDAGTLRMQDFLTRGTSCSGRALIRCHSRKTRPSCRSGSNIRSVAAASAALTTDCPRCHRNPAFWAHRLTYKAGKATLPPCCTQPEVKKQTISASLRHSAKSRYPQITDTGSLLTLLPQSQFLL